MKQPELRRSYLIQRLTKPRTGRLATLAGAFSFGGGMRNGGLSEEAMDLLRPVFGFDYMGAAEFEFGAVPEALNKIAKTANRRDLAGFTVEVPLAKVPLSWQAPKDTPKPTGSASVYVLAPKGYEAEISERVTTWATGDEGRLKEWTRLASALRPFHEWDDNVIGWLELDNGFFFFTDHAAYVQTAGLFGLDVSEQVSA